MSREWFLVALWGLCLALMTFSAAGDTRFAVPTALYGVTFGVYLAAAICKTAERRSGK